MNKSPFAWLLLSVIIAANTATATVYYWDPEGTATKSVTSLASTWNTTSNQWSTSSAQVASPVVWSSGVAADFAAGTTSVTTPFVVTLNSTITLAGIFNGSLASLPGCNVTISGTGALNLAAGADAFDTGGSSATIVSVPLTGPGQVALEGTQPVYFNGTNTFSGGTSIGYPGVLAFSSTLFFGNNASFGTGPIMMTTDGAGATLAVNGTTAVTGITNAWVVVNNNLNITGNAAGVTFSGPWPLTTTPMIGVVNTVILSGTLSGVGGFTKYGSGTLVFSGNNSFSGITTISNGILSITADNNMGAVPSTAYDGIFLSGGTLNASNTFTLNSKRDMTLTANSALSVSTGNTMTYGGVIGGAFNFTKSGAGTLAFTGANGYTGTTTISAGTLEADCQTGSSTGTNIVTVSASAVLSGSGVVSAPVTGTGTIAPGTAAGPATLSLGNGLNLSGGGTYSWNLSTNSTTVGFSTLSLLGGNLALNGSSKLSINFTGAASAPSTNNPFWLTQEAWTVISASGGTTDSNATKFASLPNGTYPTGNFSNYADGSGDIVLLYQPNYAAFDMLYDSGQGFFGGENLILTNFSGLNLSVWGSANPSLSVSNWTLIGAMTEQPLAPALPGYSRYTINVNPGTSPMFYVAGNINTGPYIGSPVPATILTTSDFVDFNVISTNVSISAAGVLGLLPSPAVIQPGSTYAGGQFQLQFSAPTNQGYTVQGSTNLLDWTNITSGTVTTSPATFTDPNAGSYSNQFYRVLLQAGF